MTGVAPGQGIVDRAFTRDCDQALSLLLAQLRREAQGHSERARRRSLVVDLDIHLDRTDPPAFALGVGLNRYRGAGGEAGGEQAGGGGAGVGAAGLCRLVDDDIVPAFDLDLMGESVAAAGDDLHAG